MMFVEFSFYGRFLQHSTYEVDGKTYTTFSVQSNDAGFIRWTSEGDGSDFLVRVQDGLNNCVLLLNYSHFKKAYRIVDVTFE